MLIGVLLCTWALLVSMFPEVKRHRNPADKMYCDSWSYMGLPKFRSGMQGGYAVGAASASGFLPLSLPDIFW